MEGINQTEAKPNRSESIVGSCPHGVDRGSVCEACIMESKGTQPIWNKIDSWRGDSKYTRSSDTNPECTIERGGKKYEISMVGGEDLPTMEEVQQVLLETFGEEEVDPLQYMQDGIKGLRADTGGQIDEARYRVFIARDAEGKVQALYQGGLIDMQQDGHNTGEKVFMGSYGVTRPDAQRQGLARELYTSTMMQTAADAEAEGKKFTTIIGEATGVSEPAWAAVGRRRIYVETAPSEYTELKYIQPALEFDKDTGEPTEDSGEASEHLMFQFLDVEPTKERVMMALEAMWRWCIDQKRDFFNNDEAYAKHKEYMDAHRKRFKDQLEGGGAMHLLSPQDREDFRKKGITIHEHTEADKQDDEGEENG